MPKTEIVPLDSRGVPLAVGDTVAATIKVGQYGSFLVLISEIIKVNRVMADRSRTQEFVYINVKPRPELYPKRIFKDTRHVSLEAQQQRIRAENCTLLVEYDSSTLSIV